LGARRAEASDIIVTKEAFVSDKESAVSPSVRPIPSVVCAVYANGTEAPWLTTIAAVRRLAPELEVVVGAPVDSSLDDRSAQCEVRTLSTLSQLVDSVHLSHPGAHILVIAWPAVLPPKPLGVALEIADSDLRCSSVSFFSNAAAYLSFPHRDAPSIHQIDDLDEQMITRRLRASLDDLPPVSIPYATGPAVLLTSQGLSVVGPFPDHGPDRLELALAEYSCRARCHGMIDYLDPSTFVLRPRDLGVAFRNDTWMTEVDETWLNARFPGVVEAPRDPRERSAALGDTFTAARAVVGGLRIVIDGSVLGPKEMGTQVAILALIKALAERSEIASIGVSLPVSHPPAYAVDVLGHPKVDSRFVPGNDLSVFGEVDIIHRPFQSSVEDDWRRTAARIVMTQHDLIAYQVPIYHETSEAWFKYRDAIRHAAADVDGLIAISEDVRRQVTTERLGIEEQRVFVVPNGVGHLTGKESGFAPSELVHRGFDGTEFLLVLGADYAHKNRGLAIEVLRELNDMGHQLSLVLAGAHVPYGSSRIDEEEAWKPDLPVYVVPDVSSEERNWLLRHASVVLYLTSAEGFGLVPHEAAAFGTPTVFVPFGPLAERFPHLPAAPADWSLGELAKATDTLLRDPALAREQIETIVADTKRYDWENTASGVLDVYRAVLARPPRRKLTLSGSDR
jgi:glycosyltransferase involved in cell wall biosynthesis